MRTPLVGCFLIALSSSDGAFAFQPGKLGVVTGADSRKSITAAHRVRKEPTEVAEPIVVPAKKAPAILPRPTSLPPDGVAAATKPDEPVKGESQPLSEEPLIDADTGEPTVIHGEQQFKMHQQKDVEGIHPAWFKEPEHSGEEKLLNSPGLKSWVKHGDDLNNHPNDAIRPLTYPAPSYIAAAPNHIFYEVGFGFVISLMIISGLVGTMYFWWPSMVLSKGPFRA